MKRYFTVFLAALMLLTLAVPTSAQNTPAFVVSSETARAGESVGITIRLQNNPGITSTKLKVAFDADLTLTSVSYNAALGGQSMQPQKMGSPVTLNWFNGVSDLTGDPVFATLTFTVSETASEGEHPITVSYVPDDVFDLAENNVDFAVVNGKVTVSSASAILCGDIDASGVIDIGDVMTLAKFIAGWNLGDSYHAENADCDASGVIDIGDVTILAKFIAGWNVVLGPQA